MNPTLLYRCLFAVSFLLHISNSPLSASIWINEIHYDNVGGDTGEFVEVTAPLGTDLSGYSITRYRDNGTVYSSPSLKGVTLISGPLREYAIFNYNPGGLQNGPSDGLALILGTTVIDFISYEGTLIASEGPAKGLTSKDILVSESNTTTPVGYSLQLTGTGSTRADFSWSSPSDDSPGKVNSGQTFVRITSAPNHVPDTGCSSSFFALSLLGVISIYQRARRKITE